MHLECFYVAGMSYEKLFDMCQIFKFSKYYVISILIFFQVTKLRKPTGQRQLLEKNTRYISNNFSYDMPLTLEIKSFARLNSLAY